MWEALIVIPRERSSGALSISWHKNFDILKLVLCYIKAFVLNYVYQVMLNYWFRNVSKIHELAAGLVGLLLGVTGGAKPCKASG